MTLLTGYTEPAQTQMHRSLIDNALLSMF